MGKKRPASQPGTAPQEAEPTKRVIPWTALTAVALSVLSLIFTAQTYVVTNRPYVGIVRSSSRLVGDPPGVLSWQFQLSNTGSIPAIVRIEENLTELRQDDRVVSSFGMPGRRDREGNSGYLVLMPEQEAHLAGQLDLEHSTEVLRGKTDLEVLIRLSYRRASRGLIFFPVGEFFYESRHRYKATTSPDKPWGQPGFVDLWGRAN